MKRLLIYFLLIHLFIVEVQSSCENTGAIRRHNMMHLRLNTNKTFEQKIRFPHFLFLRARKYCLRILFWNFCIYWLPIYTLASTVNCFFLFYLGFYIDISRCCYHFAVYIEYFNLLWQMGIIYLTLDLLLIISNCFTRRTEFNFM